MFKVRNKVARVTSAVVAIVSFAEFETMFSQSVFFFARKTVLVAGSTDLCTTEDIQIILSHVFVFKSNSILGANVLGLLNKFTFPRSNVAQKLLSNFQSFDLKKIALSAGSL